MGEEEGKGGGGGWREVSEEDARNSGGVKK